MSYGCCWETIHHGSLAFLYAYQTEQILLFQTISRMYKGVISISFGYCNKMLKTKWLKMQKLMSHSSPGQKSEIKESARHNALWRLQRKICSFPLLAFGDYWHYLTYVHSTPISVSMSTLPPPLFL